MCNCEPQGDRPDAQSPHNAPGCGHLFSRRRPSPSRASRCSRTVNVWIVQVMTSSHLCQRPTPGRYLYGPLQMALSTHGTHPQWLRQADTQPSVTCALTPVFGCGGSTSRRRASQSSRRRRRRHMHCARVVMPMVLRREMGPPNCCFAASHLLRPSRVSIRYMARDLGGCALLLLQPGYPCRPPRDSGRRPLTLDSCAGLAKTLWNKNLTAHIGREPSSLGFDV